MQRDQFELVGVELNLNADLTAAASKPWHGPLR